MPAPTTAVMTASRCAWLPTECTQGQSLCCLISRAAAAATRVAPTCIMDSMALSFATAMVRPRGSKDAWLTQLATMALQHTTGSSSSQPRHITTHACGDRGLGQAHTSMRALLDCAVRGVNTTLLCDTTLPRLLGSPCIHNVLLIRAAGTDRPTPTKG